MVHGHFVQMGGFLLYQVGEPVETLCFDVLRKLLNSRHLGLSPVLISEEEILDRSKSDAVSKVITISQTVWFIVQVITRHRPDLAVTQLELTTVALATLNWLAFILWWDKPYNISSPIQVHLPEVLDAPSDSGFISTVNEQGVNHPSPIQPEADIQVSTASFSRKEAEDKEVQEKFFKWFIHKYWCRLKYSTAAPICHAIIECLTEISAVIKRNYKQREGGPWFCTSCCIIPFLAS